MVSTRGIKLKFCENERVLCYEPDPTKAKVLYDSKVLDVVINKDSKGKKTVEYLIHFQGWNSSWDRCVSEEYVLKDTPENRQLQKDLAEKSQLQLGAYLYRKERKKHSRKTSLQQSSDDGSSGSPTRMDTDDVGPPCAPQPLLTSSSEIDSSSCDEDSGNIHIDLPLPLREFLELDYKLMKTQKKLVKLPCEPNFVHILEMYWKFYVNQQTYDLNNENKPNTRNTRFPYAGTASSGKRRAADIMRNLNICKEVLDGLRIYFDFTLHDLLLYDNERNQFETKPALIQQKVTDNVVIKEENINKHAYIDFTNVHQNDDQNQKSARKRTLRSNKSTDCLVNMSSNGNSHNLPTKPCTSNNTETIINNNNEIHKINWTILPDYVYEQNPLPPCLVYGGVHLLRLFVKLPELLNASNIDDHKLKVILQHFDLFIDFLNENKDWFSEKCYIDDV